MNGAEGVFGPWHQFIESFLWLERPLRAPNPTISPPLPCPPTHVPQSHISTFFDHHLPGHAVPVPNHTFGEIFANVQPELPLAQFRAVTSCLIA